MRDINFFSHYVVKKKQKANIKKYIYGVIVITGVIIIGTLSINSIRIYKLNREIADFENKLSTSEMQGKLEKAKDINNKIDVLQSYETVTKEVSNDICARDIVSQKLLRDITTTVPQDIWLGKFKVTDGKLVIEGTGTEKVSIAEMQHNLSNLDEIDNVFVDEITDEKTVEGHHAFRIICMLKDVV